MNAKPELTLLLASPRGFCAGVDRAIQIVELALQKFGPPVYVRHEIVHNKFVVDSLRDKGAVFVEELDECPTDRPVIFDCRVVNVENCFPMIPSGEAHNNMLLGENVTDEDVANAIGEDGKMLV